VFYWFEPWRVRLPEADADQNLLEDAFAFREIRVLKGRRSLASA